MFRMTKIVDPYNTLGNAATRGATEKQRSNEQKRHEDAISNLRKKLREVQDEGGGTRYTISDLKSEINWHKDQVSKLR
jgi:hypothetical protein